MVDIILVIPAVMILAFFLYFLLKKPSDEEAGMVVPYLLHDDNFERHWNTGELVDPRAERWVGVNGKYLGHAIFNGPREAWTMINPTGPPGSLAGLYYSLMFQVRKWEFKAEKSDEWIEVSPVHGAYYQLTMKQKEELETRIKTGLGSASQAVADLELLKHDQRKYLEFLHYFGYETDDETGDAKFDEKKRDEHSLRSLFIDYVDAHAGEQIAMKSIVSRWPTLIVDFQKLSDEDLDVDKIKDKLNVSKAEAVVLSTKNRLYLEWKKMFEPQLKERYRRINELVKSRQKSVEAYRDWLKPVIARHRLIEEGLSSSPRRKMLRSFFIPAGAQAVSTSEVTMWVWRDVAPHELQKGGTERLALETAPPAEKLPLHWEWTKKNLIFHPKHGLRVAYPWITEEWVEQKRQEILRRKQGPTSQWIMPHKLYYAFIITKITRFNIRLASGAEIEDMIFDLNGLLVSQNVLFVKLLELVAKQEELDRYADQLLGIETPIPGKKVEEKKERRIADRVMSFLNYFTLGMEFFKRGPYERDFQERITKVMLLNMAGQRYNPIVRYIKQKVNMGEG